MRRSDEGTSDGTRAFGWARMSRYTLLASLVVNLVLAAVVLGALEAPAGGPVESGRTAAGSGTMELLVGHYTIRPVNASYNSWGHAGYATGHSRIQEGDTFQFNARSGPLMGPHPERCLLIQTTMEISQANPAAEWESIGCQGEGTRTVFVEEGQLGEWYSGFFTGDRVRVYGPGYSWGVWPESPIVMDISGVLLATFGQANATASTVTRDLVEYEGEIRWEYFPETSWDRSL